MNKYYSFSSTEFLDSAEDLDAIGSRGKRVMELASLARTERSVTLSMARLRAFGSRA